MPFQFPAIINPGQVGNIEISATAAIALDKLAPGNIIYTDTRYSIGSFSRDVSLASGTQAITGVGFQPKLLIFYTTIGGTTQMSWGVDDGTTHKDTIITSVGTSTADGNNSIDFLQPNGATSAVAYISTMGVDGFTLTWTKAGSPTGTADIIFTAYR